MAASLDSLPPSPITPLTWRGATHDDWRGGALELLDQTLLPGEERVLRRKTSAEVIHDIQRLAVRGAPLLGLAGAYALVFAWRESLEAGGAGGEGAERFEAKARAIAAARPTAINLPRAVAGALAATASHAHDAAARGSALLAFAQALEGAERDACAAIARVGAQALAGRTRVLTHCNAGALVTPGLGTALAPLYLLHHRGVPVHVWVDETRPLLQGLRLTAYELARGGVPHTVIADGAAAGLMLRGEVDAAIVGADRVCRNGDVVNKVGTYAVALACRAHAIPFFVAAPRSTFDRATPHGDAVPIEERRGDGTRYLVPGTAPAGSGYREPAFDVTPAALVSGLITEQGLLAARSLPETIFS